MSFCPCNIKIDTMDCNPNNKDLWYKQRLPENVCPVRSNIINGCWECNYEESYNVNSILFDRTLYSGFISNPHKRVEYVDINSKLKNLDIPLNRKPHVLKENK